MKKEIILKIIHLFNYIEWSFIIVITMLYIYFFEWPFCILMTFLYILLVGFICEEHYLSDRHDDNHLYKYKCNYRILDITVDNKTYYFPIISILTKLGTFGEYVIEERIDRANDRVHYLTDLTPYNIKRSVKKDYNNIKDYFKNGYCYNTQEQASYVISQCEQYINNQKKITNNIKSGNLNISFKY